MGAFFVATVFFGDTFVALVNNHILTCSATFSSRSSPTTIGRTLCRRLVNEGHDLILLGRDFDKLSLLGQELDQPFAVVDIHRSQDLEDHLRRQLSSDEFLRGLVNCTGSLALKPAHSTSDDEFSEGVETNLFSAFATVRAGAKLLRERSGSILDALMPT